MMKKLNLLLMSMGILSINSFSMIEKTSNIQDKETKQKEITEDIKKEVLNHFFLFINKSENLVVTKLEKIFEFLVKKNDEKKY